MLHACSRNKRGRPSAATMASNARADLRERMKRFRSSSRRYATQLNESHFFGTRSLACLYLNSNTD
ncbi:hypothetical protein F5Y06DRAFT_280871, partial [Hypoxylon sp. FL0890]